VRTTVLVEVGVRASDTTTTEEAAAVTSDGVSVTTIGDDVGT